MENNGKMLVSRVYDTYKGKNTVVGVFIGTYDPILGKIRTGWSRVLFGSGDKFNMEKGVNYAMLNMLIDAPTPIMTDKTRQDNFYNEYECWRDRCRQYFQGDKMVNDPENLNHEENETANKLMAMGVDDATAKEFAKIALPVARLLASKGMLGLGTGTNGALQPVYGQGMGRGILMSAVNSVNQPSVPYKDPKDEPVNSETDL